MTSITTAELAIYAVLSQPILYILIKHGKPGLMGWFFLLSFCSIRVVGGALALSKSSAANIIGNVGLSPLVLAASGILHEGKYYCDPNLNKKKEWALALSFHVGIIGGIAILAFGASGLQGQHPSSSELTLMKTGISILTVMWAILVLWGLITLSNTRKHHNMPTHRNGTKLLLSVVIALIFIGIRIIYSMIALVSQDPNLNPTTGSLTLRVILSLIPELITALIFISVGQMTRNVKHIAHDGSSLKP